MRVLFATTAAVLVAMTSVPRDAAACESKKSCDESHEAVAASAARVSTVPAHIGSHCSYSTSAMIRRVLDKGQAWAFQGPLLKADDAEHSVAVPYEVGPDKLKVLANVVLDEAIPVQPDPATEVSMRGMVLEHRGVSYVVLVEATPQS